MREIREVVLFFDSEHVLLDGSMFWFIYFGGFVG